MTNEAPLDEGWYNDEKRFLRNEKIVKIESWSMVLTGILLASSLYYTLINVFSENPYYWGITGLFRDGIAMAYLVWWRNISMAYDGSLSTTTFQLPALFPFFRVLFLGVLGWDFFSLSNVFLMVSYIFSGGFSWVDFSWIQYFFFTAIKIATVVLLYRHFKTTRELEKVLAV